MLEQHAVCCPLDLALLCLLASLLVLFTFDDEPSRAGSKGNEADAPSGVIDVPLSWIPWCLLFSILESKKYPTCLLVTDANEDPK